MECVHVHDGIALLRSGSKQHPRCSFRRLADHKVASGESTRARVAEHDDDCVDALAVCVELELAPSVVEERFHAPDAEMPRVREPPRIRCGFADVAENVIHQLRQDVLGKSCNMNDVVATSVDLGGDGHDQFAVDVLHRSLVEVSVDVLGLMRYLDPFAQLIDLTDVLTVHERSDHQQRTAACVLM